MKKVETKKKGRPPTNLEAFNRIKAAGRRTIIMGRKQWKLAIPPGRHILRKRLGREYEVNALLEDQGWVIRRIS